MAVDLLTTNETYFFREPKHYELLEQELARLGNLVPISVWSAASSFGDEAYSTAMLMADLQLIGKIGPSWSILATDISHRVLLSAKEAIYPEDRLRAVSPERLRRYCLRGEGESQGPVLLQDKIRSRVQFGQLNLYRKPIEGLGPFRFCISAQCADLFRSANQGGGCGSGADHLKPGGILFWVRPKGAFPCKTKITPVIPGAFRKAV